MSDVPYTRWNGREFLAELRAACQGGNGVHYSIGDGLVLKNNVVSLQKATNNSFGGVIIGNGLNITDGVLSTELAALNTQAPLDLGEDTQTMVLLYDEDTLHVNYENKLTVRGVSGEGIATEEEIIALF